jgi:carboxyl-terminal processing protease
MPDIFIPLDTNNGTTYLYALRYNGSIQNFALNVIDKQREVFQEKYIDAIHFKNNFEVDNDLFNRLIKFAEENNLERNLSEIRTSKTLISNALKAAIGRNLFNDLGYYVIINASDKTVQKAITSFK